MPDDVAQARLVRLPLNARPVSSSIDGVEITVDASVDPRAAGFRLSFSLDHDVSQCRLSDLRREWRMDPISWAAQNLSLVDGCFRVGTRPRLSAYTSTGKS